ncbi:MAG: tetratricopeptide repeat protein [Myxococcota bacterium]
MVEKDNKDGSGELQEGLIRALRGEAEFKEVLELDDLFMEGVEQKAYSLYAAGRYYTAETLLQGLASLDSTRVYPQMLLGDIALRTDRVEKAKAHLAAAAELDGSNPVALLKLGEALIRDGMVDEAQEVLEMTVELADGDDAHVKRAKALLTQYAGHAHDANSQTT